MKNLNSLIFIFILIQIISCSKEEIILTSANDETVSMMLTQTWVPAYSPFFIPSSCNFGFGLCDLHLDDPGHNNFFLLHIYDPETINNKLYLPVLLQEEVLHNTGILFMDMAYELPPDIANALGYEYIMLKADSYPLIFDYNNYGYAQIEITIIIEGNK